MIKTIELSIPGMHCSSCEKLIGSEFEDLPGIKDFEISEPKKGGTVTFDTEAVGEQEILTAVKSAGYDATFVDGTDKEKAVIKTAKNAKETDSPSMVQHVRVELQTVADGSVSIDANGRPTFTGTMSDTKSITVDGKDHNINDYASANQAVTATTYRAGIVICVCSQKQD